MLWFKEAKTLRKKRKKQEGLETTPYPATPVDKQPSWTNSPQSDSFSDYPSSNWFDTNAPWSKSDEGVSLPDNFHNQMS